MAEGKTFKNFAFISYSNCLNYLTQYTWKH
jgi:hypothetical protein